MLGNLGAQSSLLGKILEHECPKCGKEVELPLGELCSDCRAKIEYRARKISRIVAASSTVVLAGYIYFKMPVDPTSRLVGLASIVTWYIITGLVTKRVLREFLN